MLNASITVIEANFLPLVLAAKAASNKKAAFSAVGALSSLWLMS